MSDLVKHGLDWCVYALDQMREDGTWLPSTERWIEETEAARAELVALRARVEDLRMFVRLTRPHLFLDGFQDAWGCVELDDLLAFDDRMRASMRAELERRRSGRAALRGPERDAREGER